MRSTLVLLGILGLCACSDDTEQEHEREADADAGKTSSKPQLSGEGTAISADFQGHSLSIVALEKLTKGATRQDALLESIDLADYAAGPLSVEVTSDAKLALVSLSAGFFSLPFAGSLIGASSLPSDTGKLLFVDLDERKVVGELVTGKHPMGIAITPDGKRAFVAHFGSTSVAEVDIEKQSVIAQVEVGIYAEEITLDDTGSVGIFSYSAAGNFRTFASDDMAGTLSDPVALSGDAAGVAFFPGTKIAYLVQAPNPVTGAKGGHTIIDVSDAHEPVVLEDVREDSAPIAYPAVAVPERQSVVVPVTAGNLLQLREIKLGKDNKSELVQTVEIGQAVTFGAYSVAIDAAGHALLTVPREHYVAIVDLDTGKAITIDWQQDVAGPTDITLAQ